MFKLIYLPTAEIVKIKDYWIKTNAYFYSNTFKEYSTLSKKTALKDLNNFWFYIVKSGEVRMTKSANRPENKNAMVPKHLFEIIEVKE